MSDKALDSHLGNVFDIDVKQFKKYVEPHDVNINKKDMKQFNMRFNKIDLALIDALAKRDGVSRSQLLNVLIEQLLIRMLMRLDAHEAYIIAQCADEYTESGKLYANRHWVEQIFFPRTTTALSSFFSLAECYKDSTQDCFTETGLAMEKFMEAHFPEYKATCRPVKKTAQY